MAPDAQLRPSKGEHFFSCPHLEPLPVSEFAGAHWHFSSQEVPWLALCDACHFEFQSSGTVATSTSTRELSDDIRLEEPNSDGALDHEQFAKEVTEDDLRAWLAKDRARQSRLEDSRPEHPDPELLEAEIEMVKATVGQFEAELRFIAVRRRRKTHARA